MNERGLDVMRTSGYTHSRQAKLAREPARRIVVHPTEGRKQMALECINPRDLPTPQTYTQVVVATGTRLVFVAGQEPEDVHGKLVGRGDFAAQARQVFGNLGRALAAAGAVPRHVAKITIYVVDYRRDEHLPIIEAARVSLFGDHKPADTLVGVVALSPDYLIEVDAVAVVDG
ncbi:RidA family protein [Ideonella sp. BN130291]|uniref:RidA family protein n=1 Tax=Ideonella sp. BN130291 TaxID=3112940 RepID=UPI002E275FEE|nr:RidA family protein [Ideonella sp. BN130291]